MFLRSHPLASAGSLLAGALILVAATWSLIGNERAVARARSLLTQLVADGELTAEEYATWKKIGASESETRLEVARLLQESRYAALLFDSTELIGNTMIGLDPDGRMSRELTEQLICRTLEANPRASNQAALLYLVPWLSPAGLDSAYCASVLSGGLLGANPNTLPARAGLLSKVLGQLPKEESQLHVAAVVDLMSSVTAADMDLLFSALQDVDSAEFPEQFDRAVATLTMRIATAASPADVSSLFDSVDYLKLEVTPAQLALVVDAALNRMLAHEDSDLKHGLYVTLLDLKRSYPETSFGARADYVMQGLHSFGDNVELGDYSGVLRLNEQYGVSPGSDAALGSALLDAIRDLDEREYGSSIKPHCKRFLEISADLPYEILQRGAKLLVEQLHNESFVFQRECLHDPALVERLEPGDKAELAAVVVGVLEAASQSGASGSLRRVADLLELLGLWEADLSEGQINRIKVVIATVLAGGTDALGVTNLAVAAVRAKLDFPPDFYVALFAMIVNATPAPSTGLSWVLEQFPAAQRSELIAAELQDFLAVTDPAEVASRVPVLRILSAWIAPDGQRQVRESLIMALLDTKDPSVVPALATALASPSFKLFQSGSDFVAVKRALLGKIAASTQRSDLAALFAGARTLGITRVDSPDEQAILRAAVARFLGQIVPPDGRDAAVRWVIKRFDLTLLPVEVEQLSQRFTQALGDANRYGPIASYAGSIQTLSLQAGPGELDSLLHALHAKLTSTTDKDGYSLLLSAWLAVETSTNRYLPAAQRLPLYDELLRLPLTSMEGRSLLLQRIDEMHQASEMHSMR